MKEAGTLSDPRKPCQDKRHDLVGNYFAILGPIVGLVHAHFLALTVGALLEREVRRNMRTQGIDSIPIYPEERECKAPTSPRIFELFDRADWFRHVGRRETATYPVSLTALQLQVLRLLGVPKKHYQMGSGSG